MTLDPRAESARGYMLIGIFYMHLLMNFAESRANPENAMAAFVQIKLLAPHVAVFFFLSGFGARHIGKRPFQAMATQSLMLLVLASLSHVVGYWIGSFWFYPPANWHEAARQFIKPLVIGTGYSTFVAWFFIVLAIVRMLAWCVGRGWRMALAGSGLFAGLIFIGGLVVNTPNLFEWRNVPMALLLFLIGARIPREWRVPLWVGLAALPLALILTWLNRPGLLSEGLCLDCDLLFVSQPMIGEMGFPPLYVLQEVCFLVFLLWGAQASIAEGVDTLSRFFGRYSTQLLLLHGWVLAALFPLVLPLLPEHVSGFGLVCILIASGAFHAGLLVVTRPLLDRCLALCFALARRLTSLPTVLARPRAPEAAR